MLSKAEVNCTLQPCHDHVGQGALEVYIAKIVMCIAMVKSFNCISQPSVQATSIANLYGALRLTVLIVVLRDSLCFRSGGLEPDPCVYSHSMRNLRNAGGAHSCASQANSADSSSIIL